MLPLRVRVAATVADPSSPWRRLLLWGSVIVGIVIIFGAILFAASRSNSITDKTFTANLVITASDHIEGKADSNITVVEYGDFQCPACGAYFPIVKNVVAEFGDRVRFVFRNFPLSSIHPNARAAAFAAEAANAQQKYWQMFDLLYTKQSEWAPLKDPSATFLGYATSLGLETKKFSADAASTGVSDKVDADYQSGIAASVNSTPSFFVNGQYVRNDTTQSLRNAIVAALASADGAKK